MDRTFISVPTSYGTAIAKPVGPELHTPRSQCQERWQRYLLVKNGATEAPLQPKAAQPRYGLSHHSRFVGASGCDRRGHNSSVAGQRYNSSLDAAFQRTVAHLWSFAQHVFAARLPATE